MIFWLDSGSTLTAPIEPIEEIVKRNGIFFVHGQDENMKERSSPETYKWFGADKETFPDHYPHFGGGTQASLYPSRFVQPIIERNAACAWDPSCIVPNGTNAMNHRYDQTSLSLCAHHPLVRAPHHTEYLAASRHDVNRNLLEPSYRIIWTARMACYGCYIGQSQNYLQLGMTSMDWTKLDLVQRRDRLRLEQEAEEAAAAKTGRNNKYYSFQRKRPKVSFLVHGKTVEAHRKDFRDLSFLSTNATRIAATQTKTSNASSANKA
ncbi:hypothetical protein ACA910_018695 [Epithemia clementina (nom. ined.)]